MKASNSKFDGFAHTLIAESLRKWSKENVFVKDKLNQRLTMPGMDELDHKIAKVLFEKRAPLDAGQVAALRKDFAALD